MRKVRNRHCLCAPRTGHADSNCDCSAPHNLDTPATQQNGIAITKKQSSVDAPSDAVKGSTGAVPWLYLTSIDGTVGDYKSVYRVTTVSGAAPDTCKNMQSTFTVQYAALYYFYGES